MKNKKNMMQVIKGKKGQEVIGDIPTWLITALIIIVFFFLFKLPGCLSGAGKVSDLTVTMETNDLKLNYDLMNFLRQPVEVDGEKLVMSDLIDAKMEILNGQWSYYKKYHGTEAADSYIDQSMYDGFLQNAPMKNTDNVVFMSVDKKIIDHGELYQKYINRSKKYDELSEIYFPGNYFNCYEIEVRKGNVVYKNNNMNIQQAQRPVIAANTFQSYAGQSIVFQLKISDYLYQPGGHQYCE